MFNLVFKCWPISIEWLTSVDSQIDVFITMALCEVLFYLVSCFTVYAMILVKRE